MIKQLKFASIAISDQDCALAFWTEKIGFFVTTDQPMGTQRWIEFGILGAQTGIVLFTPEDHQDPIGTFFIGSFHCDDVDHTYRQLSARGVVSTRRKSSRVPFSRVSAIPTATASSYRADNRESA